MTAQLLTNELSSLIQESKRRNQDLRNKAAEKSLAEIKALLNRSEAQLASDLKCRPSFVDPFLIACTTRSPKFATSGIVCLQRLIVTKGYPFESLNELLEAFRECSSLALDIQLKVLQALPSLLQNYAGSLRGKLLVTAFELCFLLYGSKTAVVSNTAAAALQQLVALIFDNVTIEDSHVAGNDESLAEIPSDDGTISVRGSALDAYHLLNDIYLLTEGQKGNFLITATLSQNFGLELIESVLVDYADTITAHPEQVQIYRSRLLPLIMRILSEKASFPTTVRAMRIVQLTLSHFLFALASECEMMLSLINHMLDPDAAALWKRALCLEVFRGIHSDSTLVRSIYSHFDEQEHNRNIIRDHLATLVRLASEKPAIIGLGKQSSAGSHSKDNSVEQAAIQTDGLMSTIGAVVTIAEPDTPGINTKWSNPRVSCIEQLDKSEAPTLPATYIYGLALTCINSFSEGLAKFLLPFTLPVETKGKRKNHTYPEMSEESDFVVKDRREISRSQSIRSRKLPINPLKLEGHVLYSQICTSGQMVEHCWPALLATYSTFLNATLDSDYYHSLVRSFQRFAQVAGLLDLRTPRDAFLTTLSKHAVPLSSITSLAALGTQPSPVIGANDSSFQVENQTNSNRDVSPSPSTSSIRGWPSMDYGSVTMNTRNLLCLRALLNLGIALGPVLQRSWLIILETLQQADLVMTHVEAARHQTSGHSKQPSGGQTPSDDPSGTSEFGLEVAAVKTAATRMFESTSDLPYQAFIDVLECLCGLLRYVQTPLIEISEDSNGGLLSPEASSRKHHRLPSLSGMSLDGALAVRGNISVIDRLGEISTCNITRLLGKNSVEKGWEILVAALTDSLSPKGASTEVRTKAANVLNNIILSVIISPENGSSEESKEIRKKGLFALLGEINSLCIEHKPDSKICRTCDLEIHRLSIETLQSILEQCGDSLTIGWDTIFAIITSIFDGWILADDSSLSKESRCRPKSPQLLRSSFSPLQLICSDFLSSVPHSCLLILLETLYTFCSQEQDLNVALTTLTFFQTVSEFLQRDGESIKFNSVITRCQSETELIHVIQTRTRPDSSTALWLCLLLRLTHMANDSRAEVRHSALHIFFRIFDACGDQMSSLGWQMCYSTVVSEMLRSNLKNNDRVTAPKPSHQQNINEGAWNDTTIIIVGGISKLSMQSIDKLIAGGQFSDSWRLLLKYFTELLNRQALDVSTAVLNGMAKILLEIDDVEKIGRNSITKVWNIWQIGNPACHADNSRGNHGNQESIAAYLDLFHQIHRLVGENFLPDQIQTITEQLRSCIIDSDVAPYSKDLDNLTAVQKHVLESLRMIPTKAPGALSTVIDSITNFVVMAFNDRLTKKGHTYVALSKAAMDLLGSCIDEHLQIRRIQSSALLIKAIDSLTIPLRLKYKFTNDGKEPALWRKATTTALFILEACVSKSSAMTDDPAFWNVVLDISDGILAADGLSNMKYSEISQDQVFDINAFSRMRHILTSKITRLNIPDTVRRKYAESIFKNSIIHDPHPDDLAKPGQELLHSLQRSHIGRTQDLAPTRRSKLSYILLDELFSLVAGNSCSPERQRLARASAPFLILRAGITLKAFVFDQPLRGQMPQPISQKRELLYILQKLFALDSEPGAIPDAPEITSKHQKHLYLLYPLIIQAIAVAWRDEEVSSALRALLEAFGQDFGI